MPMIKDPRWSAINLDGTPAINARLFVYQNGTDILASIYSDNTMLVPQSNPVIADGRGYFPPFYAVAGTYKIVIQSENGAPISEISNVVA